MRVEHSWTDADTTFFARGRPISGAEVHATLSQSFDGTTLESLTLEVYVPRDDLRELRDAGLFDIGPDEEIDRFAANLPVHLVLSLDAATLELLAPAYAAHNRPLELFATEVDGGQPARELERYAVQSIRQVEHTLRRR